MTLADGTRAALQHTRETLDGLPPASVSPGLALMRASLEDHRGDLESQLDALLRTRVEVVLDGDPVVSGRIRVDALTKLLHAFQEAVSAVGQALTGKATSSSSIPGPLRERTALSLAASFAGSFGAVLEGPHQPEPESDLFGTSDEADMLLDESIGQVLKIIRLAGENPTDDAPVVDEVLPLGSRAFKHLSALSDAIVDEGMTAQVSWRALTGDEGGAELTTVAARRLGDILSRNRLVEEQIVEVGLLGTVSNIRNKIELATDAGIISARVVEELVPRLRDLYDHRVVATFDVSIARSLATGAEKRSYTLVDLREGPGPREDQSDS
jgi:hypothetical protein